MPRNYTEPYDFTTFRKNLRELIDSRGIYVKTVAHDIQIMPSSLSRYLNGVRTPETEVVIKLAFYFDVSVEWLLGIKQNKTATQQLPKEVVEFYKAYSIANDTDRAIIKLILDKYGDHNE